MTEDIILTLAIIALVFAVGAFWKLPHRGTASLQIEQRLRNAERAVDERWRQDMQATALRLSSLHALGHELTSQQRVNLAASYDYLNSKPEGPDNYDMYGLPIVTSGCPMPDVKPPRPSSDD